MDCLGKRLYVAALCGFFNIIFPSGVLVKVCYRATRNLTKKSAPEIKKVIFYNKSSTIHQLLMHETQQYCLQHGGVEIHHEQLDVKLHFNLDVSIA